MSRVTLEPPTFSLVDFDPAVLAGIIEGLLDQMGLDVPVRLEVDQTTPLAHAEVSSTDPVVITAESGALEDPRKLRALSVSGATNVLGRLLLRVRDRLDPEFGAPPPDPELTQALDAAWDAYAVGRLVRLGHTQFDERQRRIYQFRNRHGFTDVSDASFVALWEGEGLRWSDIEALSASARATPVG